MKAIGVGWVVGIIFLGGLAQVPAQAQTAPSVEVLHWWTSGGEAAALAILRGRVEAAGVVWKESPISGGGGASAMRTLRARVEAGIPPTAVQVMGLEIHELASRGGLANLNELAAKEQWDKVVPAALQKFSKYDGQWVAVPVNVHSYNWVWANSEVLAKAGATAEPATWDEFIAAAEKVRKAGFVAIAHGGERWQTAMVFDSVLLSAGGPDFYRKVFIENDAKAAASPVMEQAFARMSQLRRLVDKDFEGRPWNFASAMVIHGKAAFQIMGDFAKGEFLSAGKVPGKEFLCFRVPGSRGSVLFGLDNFAMFRVKGQDKAQGQQALARLILDKRFQSDFNVLKGSVPSRVDVADTAFDECGKKGVKDLAEASRKNTLLGTVAFGHAVRTAVKDGIAEVVERHFNGELDDKQAAAAMAAVLKR